MGPANLEWDARIEQLIPNEAIGWKSVNGPKHTGRITFSPIGNDTLVQVTMNYAPPLRLFLPFVAPMTGRIEGVIERVLRDFKASAEGRGFGSATYAVTESGPRDFDVPKQYRTRDRNKRCHVGESRSVREPRESGGIHATTGGEILVTASSYRAGRI